MYIGLNRLEYFSKPTIIDCRNVRHIFRAKLFEKFSNRELSFKGILPEGMLTGIFKIVERSKLIERKDKIRISPSLT